jgi:hypothetical protein
MTTEEWLNRNKENGLAKLLARPFKNYLKTMIKDKPKTTYGKNELALFIEEIYAEFLELAMENRDV